MRYTRMLLAVAALVVALVAGDAGSSASGTSAQSASAVIAQFDVVGESFRVWVTNPFTIQQLRDLQAGLSNANIPNGFVDAGPGQADHNLPWSWHMDPEAITMAEVTIELCDASPSYVEQNLEYFIGQQYCPWSAQLVQLLDDTEADGVADVFDNCPAVANPGQENADGDALGNACDNDDDGDGYWDDDETLKGSHTLNAGSKPEHCDGVDNDGDTEVDEAPAGASWDIDGNTLKDCLDASVDTDGDGIVNTVDTDDDGDGRTDVQERKLSTDELGPCPTGASHDGWASDRDRDKDADIGDVIANFGMGKINTPASYDARSDADADGDDDIGDVIQLYGMGRINTKCATFTFTNNTGGAVDDIHIVWSQAIAEVYVARDPAPAGWSDRTLSGDGLTLDIDRPDGSGDLAAGGTLTVVVRTATSTAPVPSTCRWTLEGVDVGGC